MATASAYNNASRRQTIAAVIAAELERQAQGGAIRVDVDALAAAIDTAVSTGESSPAPTGEGTRPEDLNATNDD